MTLRLNDPALLKEAAYIGGAWIGTDVERRFDVLDPATGDRLAAVPDMGADQARRAVAAAEAAWPAWRGLPAKRRAGLLRRWYESILGNAEDLARLLTAEQGKPLAESRAEIVYGASFVEWFAEEAKRLGGTIVPAPAADKRFLVLKEPVGVVAAITPWNFPNAMITRKVAPALAAGCPVVVKPAEDTPLSALALAELAARAGIPGGVLNVVTARHGADVGRELTGNPAVRKLSFTGSTGVGKLLMAQCAGTVKKVSLELGGNAPLLVFDDADLDTAVAGALAAKYRNSGQTCVCANRLLVQDGIYDAFVGRLAAAVAALKVGRGSEDGVVQGPLINTTALAKVERLVADAVRRGARVVQGGQRHGLGGTFYQPTVLADVTPAMACFAEEIFGPVAPVCRFATEAEAVRLANDTPYGLAAYLFTQDIGRIWRVTEGLEYGMIGVNEGIISSEAVPFGGVKESGIGREGSSYGIDEYIELKYVCLGGLDAR